MILRTYDHNTDWNAALRMFREVGWVSEKSEEAAAGYMVESCRGLVAELHGSAECLVTADTGSLRYLDTDLKMSAVGSVTTSRIARKQGFASRLTAQLLADEAASGHAVAMLGMFEQGYYDQLGFGSGGYQLSCSFDPSALKIPSKANVPVRLGTDDWQAMHENRLNRRRLHGSCSLIPPRLTHADTLWSNQGFGLGYLDEHGDLSHHFWSSSKGEHGPYRISWLAYQSKEQFLELMALLKSLGDQIHAMSLVEPPGIQLQDIIHRPMKMRGITRQSPYEQRTTALAYWQARILNLQACLDALVLDCRPVRFNLVLTDPVVSLIPDDCPWKGVAGDYTITLGPQSIAEPGIDPALPTLRTSVNAFTRLWLGVCPATGLAWTGDFDAPEPLLQTLDRTLRVLPVPMPDWDF